MISKLGPITDAIKNSKRGTSNRKCSICCIRKGTYYNEQPSTPGDISRALVYSNGLTQLLGIGPFCDTCIKERTIKLKLISCPERG